MCKANKILCHVSNCRFVIPGDLDLPEISYEDLEGEPEIEEELLCRRQQEREKWLLARVNFSK